MTFVNWFLSWSGISSNLLPCGYSALLFVVGLFVVLVGCLFILRLCLKICDMVLGR